MLSVRRPLPARPAVSGFAQTPSVGNATVPSTVTDMSSTLGVVAPKHSPAAEQQNDPSYEKDKKTAGPAVAIITTE